MQIYTVSFGKLKNDFSSQRSPNQQERARLHEGAGLPVPIIELDQNGIIVGALGEPGHAPEQFAWGHFLASDKKGRALADELDGR